MKRFLPIGAVLLLLWGSQANAVVITWTGADGGDYSSSNFNWREQSLPAVWANTFSWLGGGYFHKHSGTTTPTLATLELLLDGSWTQIGSASTTVSGQVASNTLSDASVFGSVSFSGGSVSGIRFDSSPYQYQSYHGVGGSFELTNTQVPEPGTLALLGLGLIGLVIGRRVAA